MRLYILAILTMAAATAATHPHATSSDTSTASTASTASLTSAPSTTSSASAVATHTIAVGATGFTFSPASIAADVGSVVEFNFYPGNHSVVRAAYKFPCIPYEVTGVNLVGFFSGFLDSNVYSADGPKYRIRINDTEPVFFYCSAPASCIDHGMLGVINPNASMTLATQQAYAANTTFQLSPGDPLPSEGSTSASATASTSATASATTTPGAGSSAPNHAATVGITVGVVAGFFVLAGLGMWLWARRHPGSRLTTRFRHLRGRSDDADDDEPDFGFGPGTGPGTGPATGPGTGPTGPRASPGHAMSPITRPPATPSSRTATPSTRVGSPGSHSSVYKYGHVHASTPTPPVPLVPPTPHGPYTSSTPAPIRALPPGMAEMGEYLTQPSYRHRTPPPPPLPQAQMHAEAQYQQYEQLRHMQNLQHLQDQYNEQLRQIQLHRQQQVHGQGHHAAYPMPPHLTTSYSQELPALMAPLASHPYLDRPLSPLKLQPPVELPVSASAPASVSASASPQAQSRTMPNSLARVSMPQRVHGRSANHSPLGSGKFSPSVLRESPTIPGTL